MTAKKKRAVSVSASDAEGKEAAPKRMKRGAMPTKAEERKVEAQAEAAEKKTLSVVLNPI